VSERLGRIRYSPSLPHVLATALRDLSVAAALFEQNASEDNRKSLNRVNDYAEALLARFVDVQGDIRPEYFETPE
jgi:hypothetical protein